MKPTQAELLVEAAKNLVEQEKLNKEKIKRLIIKIEEENDGFNNQTCPLKDDAYWIELKRLLGEIL